MVEDIEDMRIGINYLIEIGFFNRNLGKFIHNMYNMSIFDKDSDTFIYRYTLKYLANFSDISKSTSISYKKRLVDLQIIEKDGRDLYMQPCTHWMIEKGILKDIEKEIEESSYRLKVFRLEGYYRDRFIGNAKNIISMYKRVFRLEDGDILKNIILDIIKVTLDKIKEDKIDNSGMINFLELMNLHYNRGIKI